jgi:serine/threonine-protein kinase RsbW
MPKRVAYTLDSTLESVDRVEQLANALARHCGFDEEEIHRISIAVREAAVNAILHGNANDPSKKLTIGMDTTIEALLISIADQGRGFDPAVVPDPLAPENLHRESGRGIFLIRTFMDEVNFRTLDPGAEIVLIKHRRPTMEDKEIHAD